MWVWNSISVFNALALLSKSLALTPCQVCEAARITAKVGETIISK